MVEEVEILTPKGSPLADMLLHECAGDPQARPYFDHSRVAVKPGSGKLAGGPWLVTNHRINVREHVAAVVVWEERRLAAE